MSARALGERIFLLLAVLALAPRWVFRIDSPWLFALEAPVLVVLVVLTILNIRRLHRLHRE